MKKIKLSEISKTIEKPVDIFVCFASFEKRCLTIPKVVNAEEAIKDAVVFSFKDPTAPPLNNKNKKSLAGVFGNKAHFREFSRNNPIQIADEIIPLMTDTFDLKDGSTKNLLIDISTFSREALLIFFKWLLDNKFVEKHRIQFVYNSAADYSINIEKAEEKWLSRGVSEIRSILGFSGTISPSKKLHLVIQVGFEVERALRLIESYEPLITSLGLGGKDCSICMDHYRVNLKKHQMIKDLYGNVDEFNFSCIDPVQTKVDLKRQIDKYDGYNVIIAPMNTKISAMGAALLAYERPEIQLCYASANVYNVNGYSIPGDDCYLFSLDELIKNNR